MGEDSGLEVKALKGKPGIHSARYSGHQATDQKNNHLLLKNLSGQTDRRARYVCVLSCRPFKENYLNLPKEEFVFEGFCPGSIALEEKGQGDFGYDPLFIPKEKQKPLENFHPNLKKISLTVFRLSNNLGNISI